MISQRWLVRVFRRYRRHWIHVLKQRSHGRAIGESQTDSIRPRVKNVTPRIDTHRFNDEVERFSTAYVTDIIDQRALFRNIENDARNRRLMMNADVSTDIGIATSKLATLVPSISSRLYGHKVVPTPRR